LRRALIGGYRVSDVEVAIAELTLTARRLEQELEKARERLAAAESDRQELELRVQESRAQATALAGAAEHLARAKEDADQRADQIVQAAHAEAARIREAATADAEATRRQIDELIALRNSLGRSLQNVVSDVERLLASDVPRQTPPGGAATSPPPAPSAPIPEIRSPDPPARDVFDRQIELDAGPFPDFASLSAFERALGSLPKVEDVYIRRFEGDRATIDVTLAEPAPLLDDMAERLPYRLDVRSAVADRISVIVSSAA
jgi:hypothetical protein